MNGSDLVAYVSGMFNTNGVSAKIREASDRGQYAGITEIVASQEMESYAKWLNKQRRSPMPETSNKRLDLSHMLIEASISIGMLADVYGLQISPQHFREVQDSVKRAKLLKDPSLGMGAVERERVYS